MRPGDITRFVVATIATTCLLFGVAGVIVAPPAGAATLLCAAASWVNVRSGPGTSHAIVGRLQAGQSIESAGDTTASGWTPVTFRGRRAYVSSSFLRSPGGAAAQGPIAGYSPSQLANAALIIKAGRAMGLDDWTITVGVMTAMGESSLRNVTYGDKAGPDSRGLFQQRANGAWGSYADRMNPTIAATNFFKALLRVKGYRSLTPTLAAHRTQRNRDPNHYAKYWFAAVTVFAALAGSRPAAPPTGAPSATVTEAVAEPSAVAATRATAKVNLNIRSEASLSAAIEDVVVQGTQLALTGRTSGRFSEITYLGAGRLVYTP